jgi:ABC-type polysaccharide/polyol phosphate export systems, permease component
MTISNNAGALTSDSEPSIKIAPAGTSLPDKPVVVIEPRAWLALDLQELWAYRELLYFLMWRDVKVRYKQTALGVVWVVLQPLLMMLVFTFLFGRVAGIKSDGLPYSLFAYTGLLMWTFFSSAVNAAGNSLVNSAALITKVYFPRMLVPAAAVGATLVDFAVAFIPLAIMMVFWKVRFTSNLLLLPIFIIIVVVLALGVGMWMAALNVKYRDIRLALPFLLQLWFFASPIIYPLSLFEGKVRWLLGLNPMAGIIEGFRVSLYGHKPFDWSTIAFAGVVAIIFLVYATYNFRRAERRFADLV